MILHYSVSSNADVQYYSKYGHVIHFDPCLRSPDDFLHTLQHMVPFDDWVQTCKSTLQALATKHKRIFRVSICNFEPKMSICCDDGYGNDHWTYFVLWRKN